MQNAPLALPNDVDALKALVREREEIITARDHAILRLEQQVQQLMEQFRLLRHQRFAASSEQHPGQGTLFNEAEDLAGPIEGEGAATAPPESTATPPPRPPRSQALTQRPAPDTRGP